jgi:hypothetical protein
MYKDGRFGDSNCMAQLQASVWNRCTGPSGLTACHSCALSQIYTLAKSRRDDLLSLSASHIRVMPDIRFHGAGHSQMKRNELRI